MNINMTCTFPYGMQTDAAPSEIEIGEPSSYKVEVFDSLNPRGLPTITKLLDAPAREVTAMDDVRLSCRQTRVLRRYKEDVSNKLREGLQWMLDNNLRPKLEGRYFDIHCTSDHCCMRRYIYHLLY